MQGAVYCFECGDLASNWEQREKRIPIVVGKAGLGWGRGVVATPSLPGPTKREGDQKAPAGVFKLGSAFGYAPVGKVRWIKLPYLHLSETMEGIDDSYSRYYKQIEDRSKIKNPDWRTSEKMRRRDDIYKWGLVIDHNVPAQREAGSCIFLHIWRSRSIGTAGCTAMAEKDLVQIMRWLDPVQQPLLVQLPKSSYNALRTSWNLPIPRD